MSGIAGASNHVDEFIESATARAWEIPYLLTGSGSRHHWIVGAPYIHSPLVAEGSIPQCPELVNNFTEMEIKVSQLTQVLNEIQDLLAIIDATIDPNELLQLLDQLDILLDRQAIIDHELKLVFPSSYQVVDRTLDVSWSIPNLQQLGLLTDGWQIERIDIIPQQVSIPSWSWEIGDEVSFRTLEEWSIGPELENMEIRVSRFASPLYGCIELNDIKMRSALKYHLKAQDGQEKILSVSGVFVSRRGGEDL